MAVAIANAMLLTDGDAALVRVNNRKPPHALEAGEVAAASNCRFENGQARPRYGVALDDWGKPTPLTVELVGDGIYALFPGSGWAYHEITGFIPGRPYRYDAGGNAHFLSTKSAPGPNDAGPTGTEMIGGASSPQGNGSAINFLATQTSYYLWLDSASVPDPFISFDSNDIYGMRPVKCLAYKRFSDPTSGRDIAILLTDDWRDGNGEDGGRGKAWRILPGMIPAEIPLNGHDVWDTCRIVQCDTAIVLLRHGDQRYYFDAGAVLDGPDRIQLNVKPPWALNTGQRVRFEAATAGATIYGSAPPAPGNYYYAKHITGDKIELYTDSGLANQLSWEITTNPPTGSFYLVEATFPTPTFGNTARNLIAQPDTLGNTAYEVGFDWVTENVEITDTDATTDLITAPNHGFKAGDSVAGTGITITGIWPKWAAPQSLHSLRLYDSVEAAQVDDGTTDLVDLTVSDQTGSIWKSAASDTPLPPCREGAYINGHFIGIANNDLIVVSDPGDPLHCVIWAQVIPANQGDAGRANWIVPIGDNVVAVGKDLNIIGVAGLAGPNTGWSERVITGEYNGLAPLAAVQVGTDVVFASRKGLATVVRTVAGETLGSGRTLSFDIPNYLNDVDWRHANTMAMETWNNRIFWAVPLRGQESDAIINNAVLVLNRNNQNLRVSQADLAGDIAGGLVDGPALDAWEGRWTGDLLQPYAFSRLTVNGEERLTFATADGLVCWLHDGWDDAGYDIESEIVTRGYFGGRQVLALRGKLNWDHYQPAVTVSLLTAGVNEEETLAGFDALEYDRTQYLVHGQEEYDPDTATETDWQQPYREDYSPSDNDLSAAVLDTHQNITEPFRCRVRGTSPQLRITNTQGSLRLAGVSIQAKPVGIVATREG